MSKLPEHPGNPKWSTLEEWQKMKQPQTVFLEREKETDEDLMKRFGLKPEEGSGWGDSNDDDDGGWGQPNQGGGW